MTEIEEKIEVMDEEDELEEREIIREQDDAIKKMRSMLGAGERGWRVMILRMSHPFLKGPVEEYQWDKNLDISWQDLQSRHGGGDYTIQLRDERGKVRRSTVFTIPGAAKWKGKVVTSRADVERIDKSEDTGNIAPVVQKEDNRDFMTLVMNQMQQQIQHQNEMMMLLQQQMREQVQSHSEQREKFLVEAMKMMSERNNVPASGSSESSMDVMKGAIATMGGMLNLTQKINQMTNNVPVQKESEDDDQMLMKMMANLFSMLMANKFQNNQNIPPGMIPQGMTPYQNQAQVPSGNVVSSQAHSSRPANQPTSGPVYDSPFSSNTVEKQDYNTVQDNDSEDFEDQEDEDFVNDMKELDNLSSETEKETVDYVIDKE